VDFGLGSSEAADEEAAVGGEGGHGAVDSDEADEPGGAIGRQRGSGQQVHLHKLKSSNLANAGLQVPGSDVEPEEVASREADRRACH